MRVGLVLVCTAISVVANAQVTKPRPRVADRKPGVILSYPGVSYKVAPLQKSATNTVGSIQYAIDQGGTGPAYIFLSCGTYTENVRITRSDVRIVGEERGCVQLQPADPALPAISVDASGLDFNGLGFDEVSELTISCPDGSTCSDGIRITGRTDIHQRNDWHKFSRLGIYGAFQHGISITGRTIWTEFTSIEIAFARGNGINIDSPRTDNHLTFRNVRTAYNYGYGIYVNNTEPDLINGLLFDKVNVEYNGKNPALQNCAGMYLTGISQANISSSYFEGNCAGNTATAHSYEVVLTGTYNQSVNITNSVFNLQYNEGGIFNDSVLTTGTYDGNKFTGSGTNGLTIYIATRHPWSKIFVGNNFGATATVIADDNAATHVQSLWPFAFDFRPVLSVDGESIDVTSSSAIPLYYGPYTIRNFVNGQAGQLIYVLARTTGGHVLVNGAGGTGQILFPDGMNRTLNSGESVLLLYDGTAWRPIESNIGSQSRFMGTITTTLAPSDLLAVPGLTTAAHCMYSATNTIAASMSQLYIKAGTDSIQLGHVPMSGGTFDVFCSPT